MKKYSTICPIRKANPYRRMIKATQEHQVVPNLLNRQFKQKGSDKVLLIDITYLNYQNGTCHKHLKETKEEQKLYEDKIHINSFRPKDSLYPARLSETRKETGITSFHVQTQELLGQCAT